jgi:uncharacterized protein (UPF0264 family)
MQLLVSVRDAAEAHAAVTGGADLVDAKDPQAGALGAVALPTFRAIMRAVDRARPVTAALGDARDEDAVARAAAAFRTAGASFVKTGFAGVRDRGRLERLMAAAARAAGCDAVMAVAYADHDVVDAPAIGEVIHAAGQAGLAGILIDTADKNGRALTQIVSAADIGGWAAAAHASGLRFAVAGKLTADDVDLVRAAGADICGVRGAACAGGRLGAIAPERVSALSQRCRPQPMPAAHAAPQARSVRRESPQRSPASFHP